MKNYCIYMLGNKARTVLYIGVTGNLPVRMAAHASGLGSVFTERYNITDLLYFEEFQTARQAIEREKQLKNWKRAWKFELIRKVNPDLINLWHG